MSLLRRAVTPDPGFEPPRSRHRRVLATLVALTLTTATLTGCGGGADRGRGSGLTVPVDFGSSSSPPEAPLNASRTPIPPEGGASAIAPSTAASGATKPKSASGATKSAEKAATAVLSKTSCDTVRKKAATAESGPAPVQFAKGWDAAPVEGCTYTDAQGRTVTLTAEENRMLYRVNQMRALQEKKDHRGRKQLLPDYCLYQFARKFIKTRPSGHSPMTMKMYRFGTGAGSGSSWIGENYGANSGQSRNKLAMVDRRVYSWFTSGTLTTGHYGNMMNRLWTRAGMGILSSTGSILSVQNFAANWAMWTDVDGSKCSKPPKPLSKNATLPPIGYWPGN